MATTFNPLDPDALAGTGLSKAHVPDLWTWMRAIEADLTSVEGRAAAIPDGPLIVAQGGGAAYETISDAIADAAWQHQAWGFPGVRRVPLGFD